ncbi:hypothetical protein OA2633_05156 [Oceanicaulis sp. HTCC2633]|uniref:hypothetical protein n=1 Tax=Oceanicaulis sp. HTCC2633 TaxID=314254 RepID=UPI000066D588|nr:hypothetical protein [Oceanicaulis sp. HTCC2633]EAP91539.1 hypothetical protein OA2633_05156 [Oceanicaulis sp. HTCC2633]
MKDRFDMHTVFRTLGLVVGLCTCSLAAGCASQPITLGADSQADIEAEARLRSQAARLSALVDEEGWTLTAGPADAARQFFSRLINGGEDADAQSDPVSLYVEAQGANVVLAFHEDIAQLTTLAQGVADAADNVSESAQGLGQATLTQDLASAEGALGAVRRAEDFFKAVSEGFGPDADEAQIAQALSLLAAEKTRLADAADALAERRWAAQSSQGLSS